MNRTFLGRTGWQVTRLGYGAGQLRGPGIWDGRPVSPADAQRILNAVLDVGINFIDTAHAYGPSEEFIGRFISHRREEFYLATKCGVVLRKANDHFETPRDWRHETLAASVETSLRRLRVDQIDLLQLHNPTPDDFQRYELARFLEDMQQAGKARCVGISSTLPHLPFFLKLDLFDTFQIPYSALQREHGRWLDQAASQDRGTIVRGGVAQGAPVKVDSPQGALWDKVGLDNLLEEGMSRMEFMMRFTLSHPAAHTIIVATINPDHLAQNVQAAMRGPLPPDVLQEAHRRLDQLIV